MGLFSECFIFFIRNCPKAYHPSCVNRDEKFFRTKGRWNCGELYFDSFGMYMYRIIPLKFYCWKEQCY